MRVVMSAPRPREHEVITRHMRKAAKVFCIGEPRAAGRELLVTSGKNTHQVTRLNDARGGTPKFQSAIWRLRFNFHHRAFIRPAGEGEATAREVTNCEGRKSLNNKCGAARACDSSCGCPVTHIKAAARIAEIRVATILIEAAGGLVQPVRKAAQLGGEGGTGA